jgi:hypothetical protein
MERVFVFTESQRSAGNSFRGAARPRRYAFRESEIKEIYTQTGSEQTYLMVNGIEVEGTFDDLIAQLGERVNIA